MVLNTERLVLRPWEEADAEECFKYAVDSEIGSPCGWPAHTSVEDSRNVIKNVLNGPECYAICLKENGKPIGSIELMLHEKSIKTQGDNECELGYWLGKPYWGKGIIPEAAKELLRRAFEDLGKEKVWCGYYEGNEKSKRVQEKLGFTYYGRDDNVHLSLLNEDRNMIINLMTKEDWKRYL